MLPEPHAAAVCCNLLAQSVVGRDRLAESEAQWVGRRKDNNRGREKKRGKEGVAAFLWARFFDAKFRAPDLQPLNLNTDFRKKKLKPQLNLSL